MAKNEILKLIKNAHKQLKKQVQNWKFERLEIEAVLERPVYIVSNLYFDGLLFHEQLRYHLGPDYYNLNINDTNSSGISLELDLPIQKNKERVYMASKAYWDHEIVFVSKYRKRFDDHHAERWTNSRGKIRTSMGKFKNIDQPKKMILTDSLKWVVMGDKVAIRKLLDRITCVGKKKAQGDGLVKEWKIRPTNKRGIRSFPVGKRDLKKCKEVYFGRCRPSYHNPNKHEYCHMMAF